MAAPAARRPAARPVSPPRHRVGVVHRRGPRRGAARLADARRLAPDARAESASFVRRSKARCSSPGYLLGGVRRAWVRWRSRPWSGPPSRARSGSSRGSTHVKLFSRLFRLVWGGDVDRALRPVLAVSLAGSIAGSTTYPFLGIWAIKELHALSDAARLHLPDRRGPGRGRRLPRRPLVGPGRAPADDPARLGVPGARPARAARRRRHVSLGLALLALLPVVRLARQRRRPGDGRRPRRRPSGTRPAYASVRVASNLGVTIGPPLGGLLLIGGHWTTCGSGVLPLRCRRVRDRLPLHPAGRRVRPGGTAAARLVRA